MTLDLNDEKFVNSIVSPGMAYCFNDTCPRAGSCFRRIAAKCKQPSVKTGYAIYPDALRENGRCDFFIRPRVFTTAWGFDSLFSEVRSQDVANARCEVMAMLGGKTSYYRYHRGEKKLTPELQEAIATLFERKGYGKPSYKHFKETIDFTDKEVPDSFTE